jgi:hypothetical protein
MGGGQDELARLIAEDEAALRPMLKIVANEVQEPILHSEEHERPDGSRVADRHRQVWSAIVFKADLDPFECNKITNRVHFTDGERNWYYYSAKIAMMPGNKLYATKKEDGSWTTRAKGLFVMIFGHCHLIEENENG